MLKPFIILSISFFYLFGAVYYANNEQETPFSHSDTIQKKVEKTFQKHANSKRNHPNLIDSCQIYITEQPQDINTCSGVTATFSAEAVGITESSLRYRWQSSPGNGQPFLDMPVDANFEGIFTDELTIQDISRLHEYQFRVCVYTHECDSVYSDTATLMLHGPIVLYQPNNVTVCEGDTAFFIPTIAGSGLSAYDYQWLSTGTGSTVMDISDGPIYQGTNTPYLSVVGLAELDGSLFVLEVNDDSCTVQSRPIPLRVLNPMITEQPDTIIACPGDSAIFQIMLENMAFETQWEISIGNDSSFVLLEESEIYVGTDSSTLLITKVNGLDSTYFRARLNVGACITTSDIGLLTLTTPPIGENPTFTVCSDAIPSINFQEFIVNDIYSEFQWEVISVSTGLSGANVGSTGQGNPFHFLVNSTHSTASVIYRVTPFGQEEFCEGPPFDVTVRVYPGIRTTIDPGGSQTLCPGETRTLSSTITNGLPSYIHLWTIESTTGTAYGLLDDNANSTNAMPIFSAGGIGNVKVRYTAIDGRGCSSPPAFITFSIVGTAVVPGILGNTTVCPGADHNYSVPSGFADYRWHVPEGANVTFLAESVINVEWGFDVQGPQNISVGITNAEGCTVTETITVNVVAAPDLETLVTDATCQGYADGTGTVLINGTLNSPGYSYAWSTGSTASSISNLAEGFYLVTVTDNATECFSVTGFIVNEPNPIDVAAFMTEISCFDSNDGTITLVPSGGNPNSSYTFEWDMGATSSFVSNLSAGIYSVTVWDDHHCSATETFEMEAPEAIEAEVTVINASCPDSGTGEVEVQVQGGMPPYEYEWRNVNQTMIATTPTLSNVTLGTYYVTIFDQNGCSINRTAEVAGVDVLPPTMTCDSATPYPVTLDQNGTALLQVADLVSGVADNCQLQSIYFQEGGNNKFYDCSYVLNPDMATVIAEDASGNISQCTRMVSVSDVHPPALDCNNQQVISLFLNENGNVILNATEAISATDNCGTPIISFENGTLNKTYDCSYTGFFSETFVASDLNNNSLTCSRQLLIMDRVPPIADCSPTPYEFIFGDVQSLNVTAASLVTASDNCTLASITFADGAAAKTFHCDAMTNIESLEVVVKDTDNNTASCHRAVTITDTTPPQITCENNDPHFISLNNNGFISLYPENLLTAEDDCAIRLLEFTDKTSERRYNCDNAGAIDVVTVVARGYGREVAYCTRLIIVTDVFGVCF